jgi:hypothetical protein
MRQIDDDRSIVARKARGLDDLPARAGDRALRDVQAPWYRFRGRHGPDGRRSTTRDRWAPADPCQEPLASRKPGEQGSFMEEVVPCD